jgi:hypothetical protein
MQYGTPGIKIGRREVGNQFRVINNRGMCSPQNNVPGFGKFDEPAPPPPDGIKKTRRSYFLRDSKTLQETLINGEEMQNTLLPPTKVCGTILNR